MKKAIFAGQFYPRTNTPRRLNVLAWRMEGDHAAFRGMA